MPGVAVVKYGTEFPVEDPIFIKFASGLLSSMEIFLCLFDPFDHNIGWEKAIESPLDGTYIHRAFRFKVGNLPKGMSP